ncbi:hypothetical protein CW306_21595 [Bacillus sp. BA3]|nr:hypothetical protein CW306_21595 [Bacillus sp. BA3]
MNFICKEKIKNKLKYPFYSKKKKKKKIGLAKMPGPTYFILHFSTATILKVSELTTYIVQRYSLLVTQRLTFTAVRMANTCSLI